MQKPDVQGLAAALPPNPSHSSEKGHGLPGTGNTIKVSKLREFHFSTGLLQKNIDFGTLGQELCFLFLLELQCLNSFQVPDTQVLSQQTSTSLTHCRGNFFVVICKEHTISQSVEAKDEKKRKRTSAGILLTIEISVPKRSPCHRASPNCRACGQIEAAARSRIN